MRGIRGDLHPFFFQSRGGSGFHALALALGAQRGEERMRKHAEGHMYVIGNSALHFYSQ